MALKIIIGVIIALFVVYEIVDLIRTIINKRKQKQNTNQNENNKESE